MRIGCFVAFGWLSLCTVAAAGELRTTIVSSAFAEMDSPQAPPDTGLALEEVAYGEDVPGRRFYVSGIIGTSFETFSREDFDFAQSGSVFNAGGAIGLSFDRPSGALRLEIEGRGRGDAAFSYRYFHDLVRSDSQFTNNWSTLINAWRDLTLTQQLGLYVGGGLGAGGFHRAAQEYSSIPPPVTISGSEATFAWQGGGGVIYQLNSRMTLDFGYRFYGLQPSSTLRTSIGVWPPVTLSASEFLLSVRVYEPFRRWR